MFCKYCGAPLGDHDKFCIKCGKPVKPAAGFFSVGNKDNEEEEDSYEEDFSDFDEKEEYDEGEEKTGKNSRLLLIIIVVLLCAIVAVAAVLFLRIRSSDSKKEAETTGEESEEQTESDGEEETEASESQEEIATEIAEIVTTAQETATEVTTTAATTQALSSPTISAASATSSLSEYGMTHTASLVIDGDLTTGWVEGADGQGIGESITLTFADTSLVEGFVIFAGYQKSDELYEKNSRPRGITLTFSDGTEMNYELSDLNGAQSFTFPEPVTAKSVTLTINSVYAGTTYEDTVISEILFN